MPTVSRRYAPSASDALPEGAPVVLMVSGGADSTALLVMAATEALDLQDGRGPVKLALDRLCVLHINHQLRGVDAEKDEEFVRSLSAQYGIACVVRRLDIARIAADEQLNVEDAGRRARYEAANRLANELCASAGVPRSAARIMTAHNANDRAETFLMNVTRGTGVSGLASIPRRRNRIVRPLLSRTHLELCNYLVERGISWREDLTNVNTYYLRSYVRHQVVPRLEARNPRVLSAIAGTCDIVSDEDAYLNGVATRRLRELLMHESKGYLMLNAAQLAVTEVVIARRVVRIAAKLLTDDPRLEAHHVESVLEAVAAGRGSVNLPRDIQARVSYGTLALTRIDQEEEQTHISNGAPSAWLPVPGMVQLSEGRTLRARLIPVEHGLDVVSFAQAHGREWLGESVLLDAGAAGIDGTHGGRLWAGPPQPGDVLCPLGMHGQSKKLSDLLSASRLPLIERNRVPIVHTSPKGRIVWVAGIRADERSKCTQDTKLLLELSLHEEPLGLPGGGIGGVGSAESAENTESAG